MTRFMITLEDAVQLVWVSLAEMQGGEIYVKKIPSMKLVDIASAVNPDANLRVIGVRPGEKLHEELLSQREALLPTHHEKIMRAETPGTLTDEHLAQLAELSSAKGNHQAAIDLLSKLIPEYQP